MRALQRFVTIILCHQLFGALGKGLVVCGGPPVAQRALGIILAALIVETMADFMADDGADAAVIDGRISLGIKKRRLQDGGGEHHLVHWRVVIGVDHCWCHEPFAAIERRAQFGEITIIIKAIGAIGIANCIARHNLHPGIIAPLVGVTDLGIERCQLDPGFFLGLSRHPVGVVDALAHGGQQVFHQIVDLGLGIGGKIFVDIQPANGFTHHVVDAVDAAFPSRLIFRLAGEHLAVEGEVFIDKRLGQHPGTRLQDAQRQIILPHRQRLVIEQFGTAGKGAWLADIKIALLAHAGRIEERRPVEPRRTCRQRLRIAGVIGFHRVAVFHTRPMRLGDGLFEAEHGLGARAGVVEASQCEHRGNVIDIFGARFDKFGIVDEVIITIGHAQPALADADDIAFGVLGILFDVDAEWPWNLDALRCAQRGRQFVSARNCRNAIERRLDRSQALRLDGGFVHIGCIIGADAAGIVGRAGVRSGSLDDFAGALSRQVIKHIGDTIA